MLTSHTPRRAVAAAVTLALGLALLTGCGVPELVPVASATPEPLPTVAAPAEPVVASVAIGGLAFSTLDADGAVIDTVEYSGEAEAAMDVLNDAFGAAPELTKQETDNSCVAEAWIADWSDAFYLSYDTVALPPGQIFAVAAKAPTVNGVTIATPDGVAVGASLADLQASIPGVHSTHYEWEGTVYDFVHYDVGVGTWVEPDSSEALSDEYWGARADVTNDAVERLVAPVWYFDAC